MSVLDLPDACLLAVLQYLVDDAASLCSAARSHSRLQQAAVVTLRSISTVVKTQHQLDNSLLLYLHQHGQHISSIELRHDLQCDLRREMHRGPVTWPTAAVSLRQLPPILQLTSLQFDSFQLQLQAGDGSMGVLGVLRRNS